MSRIISSMLLTAVTDLTDDHHDNGGGGQGLDIMSHALITIKWINSCRLSAGQN